MIKTRPQKKTTSQLIAELDTVFSQYCRLRDADKQGIVTCFVTGERIYFKDCDAAHFIDRAHMATRWDEMNVHACSRDSNRYDQDHKSKYKLAMIRKYGNLAVVKLEHLGHSLMKFTSAELLEKLVYYRLECEELRALKKI